jgi:hypothetical protein
MTKQTKVKSKEITMLKVILGGKEYELRPLTIKESREWREKAVELLSPLPEYAAITTDTPESFVEAVRKLALVQPARELDLFFEYAKDLDREKIENEATDAEMAIAFAQVFETVFALVRGLGSALVSLSK